MSAAKIACVVLASGLSKRFGETDKLLAELCGKPVLSHVLDTARDVGFGEIFCVSRFDNIDGISHIENECPEKGQGHAVRLGVAAAQASGWEICVILLGDMPLVTSSHIKALIEKCPESGSVVSVSESIKMPPALFDAAAMDAILSQTSASGARDLFDQLNPATLQLDAEATRDVDTPADLARVEHIMKARKL